MYLPKEVSVPQNVVYKKLNYLEFSLPFWHQTFAFY